MAYNKTNKDKIQYYLDNPDLVYNEYIIQGKTNATLAEEWGLPSSTVYNIIKKLGLVGMKFVDKITSCDESLFNINNPVFCYMAGLASADGYIDEKNHRLVLRMNEDAKEILEKIRVYFKVSNSIKVYTGSGGYTHGYIMYDLTISSKKLLEELKKLNLHGRKKDLNIRFPDMTKLTDINQEMYMRGLWDGDGTIRKDNMTSIFSESKLTIEAIYKYMRNNIGLNVEITPRVEHNTGRIIGYDLTSDSKSGIKFYNWLYRHNLEIKMESKYLRQF